MKKIQTKIIMLVVLVTLCSSLINGVQSMFVSRYSTTSAIKKNLLETTELAALAAKNIISTYTLTISEIASNPALLDEQTTPEEKQVFIQARADAYYMRFGGMADSNGYDVVHDVDISSEPFFAASMQGQSYMSVPYIEGSDSYLIVSAPVMDGDTVKGVLYFQCDTDVLSSIIEGIQIGEEGEAYILDKDGTTIAYMDQQSVLEKENVIKQATANPNDKDLQTVAAIERRMVAGETGIESYFYAADNTNNIQGFAPIQGTDGWSIAVNIDEDEFMRPAHYGNLFTLGICAVVCLIVIIISFRISRSIARPIVKCANRLQLLSEGDLKSSVPYVKSKDETRILSDSTANLVENLRSIMDEMGKVLGAIANGDLSQKSTDGHYPGDFSALQNYLRIINEKLSHTMTGIISASDQVSESSNRVASTGMTLSQGAAEQAEAVEELSATFESISKDAKKTARLTENAKNTVDEAGTKLQESSAHIKNLNEAMDQITASSNEIERIIDTIESISFQTNILALNASVEAARAGTAGKGFAVVADEVRSLAVKSDQAAKATHELIQRSVDAVESGSRVVREVTDSVTDAVSLAGQTVEQMELVTEAVEKQTEAVEQAAQGISQISAVVQSNSATAQESAATSQELSEQADTLEQLVSGFKVG